MASYTVTVPDAAVTLMSQNSKYLPGYDATLADPVTPLLQDNADKMIRNALHKAILQGQMIDADSSALKTVNDSYGIVA